MKLRNPKRWYWWTLRYVAQLPAFFRPLRRGTRATVVTTTWCNLHCGYCPMFIYGEPKKYPISTFEEWKGWFERFPVWISQVYVSGGEPSTYPDIVPLVNWLVNRGHHVIVFTNLFKYENFKGIKPHWRLIFQPTFHKGQDDFERYNKAQRWLREEGLLVTTQQIKVNPYGLDRIKEFFTKKWFADDDNGFQFAPDTPKTLQIWSGCIEMYHDK